MARFLIACLMLALPANAFAQQSPADRVKALEAENRQLRDEVQALKQRLQSLEGQGAATTTAPATTNDPGANPWGNPDAVRRTIGQALRENLQARNIALPDAGSDAKTMAAYRKEVERWWQESSRTKRFRQSVTWPIEILEASVASNSGTREYDITAYALNDAGARVGKWFVIRCPASAVPNLNPLQAAGRWTLRADVQPEVSLIDDRARSTNVFHQHDPIAPQTECSLRFSVAGIDPVPVAGAEPATKGRGAR